MGTPIPTGTPLPMHTSTLKAAEVGTSRKPICDFLSVLIVTMCYLLSFTRYSDLLVEKCAFLSGFYLPLSRLQALQSLFQYGLWYEIWCKKKLVLD